MNQGFHKQKQTYVYYIVKILCIETNMRYTNLRLMAHEVCLVDEIF